jgi:hypothetical protein
MRWYNQGKENGDERFNYKDFSMLQASSDTFDDPKLSTIISLMNFAVFACADLMVC